MSPAEALLAASVAAVLVSLATGLAVTAEAHAESANATAAATASPEVLTALTTPSPTPTPMPSTPPGDSDATNGSSAADAEDPDYYSSYDYPDLANYSQDDLSSVEPGVIPEPSTLDDDDDDVDNEVPGAREPAVGAAGEVGAEEAAGAGGAPREWRPRAGAGAPDPDLHDHDVIDSVMYIYFGQQRQLQLEREQRSRNSWRMLVAGTVAALAAQLLTLVAAARRLRDRPRDCAAAILLNAEAALAAASLVFLAGVQATRTRQLCEAVSLVLHYVHLAAACWLFTISVHVLHALRGRCRQLLPLACPLAWLMPALVVLGCYLFNPHSYETRRYCWMSVERGMMFSYLVPVASLIFANTVVTVACVRELARRELQEKPVGCPEECCCGGGEAAEQTALCLPELEPELAAGPHLQQGQRALRRCAWLLPLFAIAWFLSVVALENPHALTLSFLHGLTTGILNWYMYMSVSAVLTPCEEPPAAPAAPAATAAAAAPAAARESLDCQPLLGAELPPPGAWPVARPAAPQRPSIAQRRGELLEMSVDCISTITA